MEVSVMGTISVNIFICDLGKMSRSIRFTDNNDIERTLSTDGDHIHHNKNVFKCNSIKCKGLYAQ